MLYYGNNSCAGGYGHFMKFRPAGGGAYACAATNRASIAIGVDLGASLHTAVRALLRSPGTTAPGFARRATSIATPVRENGGCT